jgi:hypothetical protein
MLRVQNQIKQDVSSGLSLAVGVMRGDLQVTLSPDQKKFTVPRTVCRYLKGACH